MNNRTRAAILNAVCQAMFEDDQKISPKGMRRALLALEKAGYDFASSIQPAKFRPVRLTARELEVLCVAYYSRAGINRIGPVTEMNRLERLGFLVARPALRPARELERLVITTAGRARVREACGFSPRRPAPANASGKGRKR